MKYYFFLDASITIPKIATNHFNRKCEFVPKIPFSFTRPLSFFIKYYDKNIFFKHSRAKLFKFDIEHDI